jgi:hypothetical protein
LYFHFYLLLGRLWFLSCFFDDPLIVKRELSPCLSMSSMASGARHPLERATLGIFAPLFVCCSAFG